MYTRADFGKELKERVAQKNDLSEVGSWAYEVYLGETPDNDREFLNILLILNTMEDGYEFELSYERLNEISNDLIAGREVNMDY